MDSGDIPKDLFEGLDGGSKSPPRTESTTSTTTLESVQAPSAPPINITTNPAVLEEDGGEKSKPSPRVPLPPPVVATDGAPLPRPKKSLAGSKFSKTKWKNLQQQVLLAAQEQSVINPPPPVPVDIEKSSAAGPVFPVVAPTHTSTFQPSLVVPLEPKRDAAKPHPLKATKKLSFLGVVQAARAKAKEGMHDILDTEGDVEGIVRGEEPSNVYRVPSPPQSPAMSSYTRYVINRFKKY